MKKLNINIFNKKQAEKRLTIIAFWFIIKLYKYTYKHIVYTIFIHFYDTNMSEYAKIINFSMPALATAMRSL